MIKAGSCLYMGGPPDVIGEEKPFAVFSGSAEGRLLVADAVSGEIKQTIPLASQPVFDGITAADGRLFVVCADGSLLCMGKAEKEMDKD
jgi:hypothetical protein